jgi:hypothetical protein
MPAGQVGKKGVLDHLDLDTRVGAREFGQRLWQQMVHHDEGGRHTQRTGQFAIVPEDLALDLLGARGDVSRLFQQRETGLGRWQSLRWRSNRREPRWDSSASVGATP